jgi:hypothetical protein
LTNPMTTTGDIIIGGASGVPTRLAAGSNNRVLTIISGSPSWQTATGFANPMTSVGDLIVGGASGAATRLGAPATGQLLISQGAGTAPIWSQDPAIRNLLMQGGTVGTSGVGVLTIGPSTAPTTSPVDTVQLYTEDFYAEAGSRALVIRSERGGKLTWGNLAVDSPWLELSDAAMTTRVGIGAGSGVGAMGTIDVIPLDFRTGNTARMRLGTDGRLDLMTGAGLYIGPNDDIRFQVTETDAILEMLGPGGGHHYQMLSRQSGAFEVYDVTAAKYRQMWNSAGGFYLGIDGATAKVVSATAPDSAGAGWRYLIITN